MRTSYWCLVFRRAHSPLLIGSTSASSNIRFASKWRMNRLSHHFHLVFVSRDLHYHLHSTILVQYSRPSLSCDCAVTYFKFQIIFFFKVLISLWLLCVT